MLRHGHAHHYKQYVTNWAALLTKSRIIGASWGVVHENFPTSRKCFPHYFQRCERTTSKAGASVQYYHQRALLYHTFRIVFVFTEGFSPHANETSVCLTGMMNKLNHTSTFYRSKILLAFWWPTVDWSLENIIIICQCCLGVWYWSAILLWVFNPYDRYH